MGDFGAYRTGSTKQTTTCTQEVLPQSEYLQERLQERRSRHTSKLKRSRHTDLGIARGRDDEIFLADTGESRSVKAGQHDSTPTGRGGRLASDAGTTTTERKRRQLGAKELDEQLDRLLKENFALKLELDHRREHTATLNEHIQSMKSQVERAEKLEDEHGELLRINSQLIEELEKREKAIEEAMDIICDLEDRVAELEQTSSNSRPTTAHADSGYAGTETQEPSLHSSPSQNTRTARIRPTGGRLPPPAASAASRQLMNAVNGAAPAKPKREPSFVTTNQPSTQVLRNVYLQTGKELHAIKSFNSLLSAQHSKADDDEAVLNSPRLSMLSESSFQSLYSPEKKHNADRYNWEGTDDEDETLDSESHHRQYSIHRVSQWIADGDDIEERSSRPDERSSETLTQAPKSKTAQSSPSGPPSDQPRFQSLNTAVSGKMRSQQREPSEMLPQMNMIRPCTLAERQLAKHDPQTPTMSGPTYGTQLFPPTPDSASTHLLRASRSSLAGKRDDDLKQVAVERLTGRESGVRTAPKQSRSSVELAHAYQNSPLAKLGLGGDHSRGLHQADDDSEATETVVDFMEGYYGYPDGNSILMGTPSRFLHHSKVPEPKTLVTYQGVAPNSASQVRPERRQSSSEVPFSASRPPPANRAETSPAMVKALNVAKRGEYEVQESLKCPKSAGSASSGNQTVLHADDERYRQQSPDSSRPQVTSPLRSQSRASPSPTFAQRTQKLFRRMSNSRERSRDGGTSPLPTLTRTPSSAYINQIPKAQRRPSQSRIDDSCRSPKSGNQTPTEADHKGQSAGNGSAPLRLDRRGNEPLVAARPATSLGTERSKETRDRLNPFRRSNSSRKVETSAKKSRVSSTGENPKESSRRGSLREAVGGTRRPWR